MQQGWTVTVGVLFDLYQRVNSLKACSVLLGTMCGRHIQHIVFPYLPVQRTRPQLYCVCAAQILDPHTSQQLSLVPLAVDAGSAGPVEDAPEHPKNSFYIVKHFFLCQNQLQSPLSRDSLAHHGQL